MYLVSDEANFYPENYCLEFAEEKYIIIKKDICVVITSYVLGVLTSLIHHYDCAWLWRTWAQTMQ